MKIESLWKIHKRCRVLALARYRPEQESWFPFAVVLHQSAWEKHVAFLNPPAPFAEQEHALEHAMKYAVEWCDEHYI